MALSTAHTHCSVPLLCSTDFAYHCNYLCFCTHGVSHIIGSQLFLNCCLFQVYPKEPLVPMKQRLKEEGEGGEEPAHKKVKTEVAETVEVKFEGHTQVCVCR